MSWGWYASFYLVNYQVSTSQHDDLIIFSDELYELFSPGKSSPAKPSDCVRYNSSKAARTWHRGVEGETTLSKYCSCNEMRSAQPTVNFISCQKVSNNLVKINLKLEHYSAHALATIICLCSTLTHFMYASHWNIIIVVKLGSRSLQCPGQLQKTPSQNSRDLDLELEAIIAMSHNRLRQVYNRLRHPPRKLFWVE